MSTPSEDEFLTPLEWMTQFYLGAGATQEESEALAADAMASLEAIFAESEPVTGGE
jgi:hypothetical protein